MRADREGTVIPFARCSAKRYLPVQEGTALTAARVRHVVQDIENTNQIQPLRHSWME
jgi:hypothetical protein